MSLIRSAVRLLRLGKYKHFQGTDLNGNEFFERPHPEAPSEWRQAKRYVEYLKAEPLSEYGYKSIPGTFRGSNGVCNSLTLESQFNDVQRQLKLQENVRRLEQEYREEKMRLAEAHQAALLQASEAVRGAVAREGASAGGVESAAEPSQEGMPLKDGGAGEIAGKRAAEIARQIGTGEGGAAEATSVPAGATPEEMAEMRRRQEREAAMKRRADFAKRNPTPLHGNPGDAHQPAGWTPSAPARRRE
ncbi:NADH:ubiquinone oxidoreductase, 17.2kDa subunit [Rhodotorula toruloides]|uniref:NADH:ubiquinone oxidoreductase, 17.2kDa subunit n=1 Tax=Rhodotorula toruloides TaxID=5286 RepID=A0A511KA60_RHOTO|nr:NADH:ubiquinone oxidoreductase, 17.2kDa subunit [Rhodotorula toruloides]